MQMGDHTAELAHPLQRFSSSKGCCTESHRAFQPKPSMADDGATARWRLSACACPESVGIRHKCWKSWGWKMSGMGVPEPAVQQAPGHNYEDVKKNKKNYSTLKTQHLTISLTLRFSVTRLSKFIDQDILSFFKEGQNRCLPKHSMRDISSFLARVSCHTHIVRSVLREVYALVGGNPL